MFISYRISNFFSSSNEQRGRNRRKPTKSLEGVNRIAQPPKGTNQRINR